MWVSFSLCSLAFNRRFCHLFLFEASFFTILSADTVFARHWQQWYSHGNPLRGGTEHGGVPPAIVLVYTCMSYITYLSVSTSLCVEVKMAAFDIRPTRTFTGGENNNERRNSVGWDACARGVSRVHARERATGRKLLGTIPDLCARRHNPMLASSAFMYASKSTPGPLFCPHRAGHQLLYNVYFDFTINHRHESGGN